MHNRSYNRPLVSPYQYQQSCAWRSRRRRRRRNVRAPVQRVFQVCHPFCPFNALTDVLRQRSLLARRPRRTHSAALSSRSGDHRCGHRADAGPRPPITTPVCCCSRSPARSAPPSPSPTPPPTPPVPTPPASTATGHAGRADGPFVPPDVSLRRLPFRLAPPRRVCWRCLEASAVAAAARIGRPTRPSSPAETRAWWRCWRGHWDYVVLQDKSQIRCPHGRMASALTRCR